MNYKLLLISCLIAPGFASQAQDGEVIYKKYCGGCHGRSLQGGSAGALIKKDWKYGGGEKGIYKTIKNGIPHTEMIAWGNVLTHKEITSVTNFIIRAQDSSPKAKAGLPQRIKLSNYEIKVATVVNAGLETPWAIEFIDDNTALISERRGNLRLLKNHKLYPLPIRGMPETHVTSSTGGYMDIAIDPNYVKNGWIYLAYSHTTGDVRDTAANAMTKIVRGRIKNQQWKDEQTLFQVPESLMVSNGNRWGCRFLFDKKGLLYFTIGDMAQAQSSQDLSRPTGKIFRINPDGSIPKDNPFVTTPGALPAIFTIGVRNAQGLAQEPLTGKIWFTEHGPRGGDELNILKKGANYGWPLVTYGVDYDGTTVSDKTHQSGLEPPVIQWTPSIAICPAEFYSGSLFTKWKNNLFIGALAYEELQRLTIKGDEVVGREMIFKGFGRVRDIKTAPDGSMYVVLNGPDKIVKLTPVASKK